MDSLESLDLAKIEKRKLLKEFLQLEPLVAVLSNPELTAQVVVLGMSREIGTVNDEIARFVFDAETGLPVQRESLYASAVIWKNKLGIRVQARGYSRLELRARGLRTLLHPRFSENEDGTLHSLTLFPEICARIAEQQGIELVLPRAWALNSIFGGFDPAKAFYQTNIWELENNDTIHFASLLECRRLALLGTHDLVAHVAGLRAAAWDDLVGDARRTRVAIQRYLQGDRAPSMASLVLPYTVGVVLDDLAQPPSYGSLSHRRILNALIHALEVQAFPAQRASKLLQFPMAFENVIRASRRVGLTDPEAERSVNDLVEELWRVCAVA